MDQQAVFFQLFYGLDSAEGIEFFWRYQVCHCAVGGMCDEWNNDKGGAMDEMT
jgi:hypothetical protein